MPPDPGMGQQEPDGRADREALLNRGVHLEYFTIGYNLLEAVVAVGAGLVAGSIALTGFGFDSLIEVTAAGALLWRFKRELGIGEGGEAHHAGFERKALFVVALTFFALALYVVIQAVYDLTAGREAAESPVGIILAAVSLAVMPALAIAKQRVARALDSKSLASEAKETWLCSYLSLTLLVGLLLNALFGWHWADPLAALAMLPLIVKEGLEALEEAREED